MTVISEPISSIAGADERTVFTFSALLLRESADGTGMVTTQLWHGQAVDGVLTTPDLDPGPAVVRVGAHEYRITIPDSETPVRLWPRIQEGLPVPPEQEAAAVRNGGGISRIQALTQTEYDAIPSPDSETLYLTTG
ncbi:phage upper tail fiber protein [Nocardia puris]|uniref:Minor tail protein gp31 C-terminal domain-containing protein n=1 Tax=Nocardia puris TaxID=208602 RepID=A0A366DAC3_9NOCA|nr:hypothetical protein [Nocardia puris]RBO87011.1 hypothetical protein DFR74_112188 [Nocardia puris]